LSTHPPSSSRLTRLGWSASWQSEFASLGDGDLSPARVAEEHRDGYVVFTDGGALRATVSGRLRHEAQGHDELPAVGDWIAAEIDAASRAATIRHVLPRRSSLVRKAAGTRTDAQVVAANVDLVFVVTSANQDFNAPRLARYLTAVWESGAQPVVLVAKSDLADDVLRFVSDAAAAAPGADVLAVSAVDGRGVADVEARLASGTTAAFVGSSGVGKSTLVNRLLGEERLAVRAVRAHDDRGVHTTTSRQLVELPSGACVIDTPGMRELLPWDAAGGLAAAFADVEELAASCRFRDCRHDAEPGCAVLAAAADGSLARERYEQWRALGRELAYLERKQNVHAMQEERRRWKAISKQARAISRRRDLA
jgi:ribosome biogenesis GTPase / thiamine phosphate phosphatase